jgi:hypothetical protein
MPLINQPNLTTDLSGLSTVSFDYSTTVSLSFQATIEAGNITKFSGNSNLASSFTLPQTYQAGNEIIVPFPYESYDLVPLTETGQDLLSSHAYTGAMSFSEARPHYFWLTFAPNDANWVVLKEVFFLESIDSAELFIISPGITDIGNNGGLKLESGGYWEDSVPKKIKTSIGSGDAQIANLQGVNIRTLTPGSESFVLFGSITIAKEVG